VTATKKDRIFAENLNFPSHVSFAARASVAGTAHCYSRPRRDASEVFERSSILDESAQGKPSAGSARRLMCEIKAQQQVTTGSTGATPAFPAQWF
jgi:hypothetical protein